jgi:hypothetical protein
MTSANFFNGYDVGKPTSKVMAPPGGRSNDIFGTDSYEQVKPAKLTEAKSEVTEPEHQKPQQKAPRPPPEPIVTKPARPAHGVAKVPGIRNQQESSLFGSNYSDEPAKDNKRAEVKSSPEPEVNNGPDNPPPSKNLHTSSRVLQPPGGKSNGPLW